MSDYHIHQWEKSIRKRWKAFRKSMARLLRVRRLPSCPNWSYSLWTRFRLYPQRVAKDHERYSKEKDCFRLHLSRACFFRFPRNAMKLKPTTIKPQCFVSYLLSCDSTKLQRSHPFHTFLLSSFVLWAPVFAATSLYWQPFHISLTFHW